MIKITFQNGLLVATLANAVISPSWQSVVLVALAVAYVELTSRRSDSRAELMEQMAKTKEAAQAIEQRLLDVEKKQAETHKIVSTSTIAQAFRPRVKDAG